jgi:hypothetical protein
MEELLGWLKQQADIEHANVLSHRISALKSIFVSNTTLKKHQEEMLKSLGKLDLINELVTKIYNKLVEECNKANAETK